jgi:micrococcal nuclease
VGRHAGLATVTLGPALGLALLLVTARPSYLASATTAEDEDRPLEARVTRVVDAATVSAWVDGRMETVRYIGVGPPDADEPTRHAIELEAIAFCRRWLIGRPVRLELDTQERDGFGRLLAYVWVDRFGTELLLNAELIRQGHARAVTTLPNSRHRDLLLRAEQEARSTGRGLWAPDLLRRRP